MWPLKEFFFLLGSSRRKKKSLIVLFFDPWQTRRKNDIIRRLQEEIRQIDKQSEDNIRRVKMEAEKNISSELKTSDGKCAKIQQELILSRNSLQNLTNDHRNQEMELRRVSASTRYRPNGCLH